MWPYPDLYVMSEEGAYGSLLELGVSLLRSTISLEHLARPPDCPPDCSCCMCYMLHTWIRLGRKLIDWTPANPVNDCGTEVSAVHLNFSFYILKALPSLPNHMQYHDDQTRVFGPLSTLF